MNKSELISAIQTKGEYETKKAAEAALTAVLDAIKEGLTTTGSVQIIGFGNFEVKERAEREGFKPGTKEKMTFPASKSVGFKAGAALKELVK